MKIEQLKTADLVPYARNSRTHDEAQVAQIAGSIREFGFTNPILIDAENGIIAGHGRVIAARKLGLDKVPCIRLSHLTEAQRRAYVIADNKLALNAGWDEEMLALEFSELIDLDYDATLTGFTKKELDGILGLSESFVVESKTPRSSGKGPYHVKDVCIGAFAVVTSSTVPEHKEILAKKKNDPDGFAARITGDFLEMLSRPGPAWPRFDFVTMPATTKKDHPLKAVGASIAKTMGTAFEEIFLPASRKTRGLHSEEKPQALSRSVEKCSILLIDDVITTGRTMRNCVDQIHKSGGICRPFAWLTYQ